jgi:rhodanese-related sulfurtransferase
VNPQIPQLTPAQTADRTEAVLLDVREATELAGGRIAGSTHIPLGQLAARAFELDRSRPVITVCRSGGRSSQAARFLAAQGYDVTNLDGGMTRWTTEGRPTV